MFKLKYKQTLCDDEPAMTEWDSFRLRLTDTIVAVFLSSDSVMIFLNAVFVP